MARRRKRVVAETEKLVSQGKLVDLDTIKQTYATHDFPFESSLSCILIRFFEQKNNKSNEKDMKFFYLFMWLDIASSSPLLRE